MSVLGKVGNINEISTVRLGKQSLLAEGTIADLTGKITISLSEDNREFKIRSLRTTDYGLRLGVRIQATRGLGRLR